MTPAATQGNPASTLPRPLAPGTEVLMPQMGESITEGTITKWLKKVGDTVQRDEPIFEISTDKVDAEIPSPVAGTLTEIKVQRRRDRHHQHRRRRHRRRRRQVRRTCRRRSSRSSAPPAAPAAARSPSRASAAAGEHVRSSPLVRKIAKDNNVDLTQVPGTGASGRITKSDIVGHLEGGAEARTPQRRLPLLRRQPPPSPQRLSRSPASSSP